MVVADDHLTDLHFFDLPGCLRSGDVLVLNDTRVINARLIARRPTGGQTEILLVDRQPDGDWLALIRPAKRVSNGDVLVVSPQLSVQIIEKNSVDTGDGTAPMHRVRLLTDQNWEDALAESGNVPLPPYIRDGMAKLEDQTTYQTVVASTPGAVAAPTAGLHFTESLLAQLRAMGVSVCTITLHVGYGTFKPISAEVLDDHRMHEERYSISEETAAIVTAAKQEGRRVIAVGTTVTRCLESAWQGQVISGPGATSLFLRPGSKMQVIDGLITNFHLPRSSLLVLVSALVGIDRVRSAYSAAISRGYRFYSYGDAMLLWVPH